MNDITYDFIYIISNAFGTYIIYKFMNTFFEKLKYSKNIELIFYIMYFLVSSSVYLFINIPIITMIINVISFVVLSLNYNTYIKKRILSISIVYMILVCIEIIVALMTGYLHNSILKNNEYSSAIGVLVVKLISYAVVCILSRYKKLSSDEKIPNYYWMSIILMPISSTYIILLIFTATNFFLCQTVIAIVLLLLLNFSTFYLYEAIVSSLTSKMENKLILQQNQYYENQFKLMELSLKNTNELKHDLRNHLSSISILLKDHGSEEALEYISEMIGVCDIQSKYAYSGNVIIDSIINFKLDKANQKNIDILLDLHIPSKINIPVFDITVLFGNLLDNALYAVENINESRFIRIWAKYDKGRFILKVDNPFSGHIQKNKNIFLTTKIDKSNHGIGLESIKNVLKKYDGTIDIEHSNNMFSVTLLMYI